MSDTQTEISFVPLYDNILITKKTGEKKSSGGIIIVDDNSGKSYSDGTVIKTGEGFKLQDGGIRPLKVQPGDEIIFRKMTEISIELNGKEYFIVSEANVVGIQ